MNHELVDRIVNAVLYEGYILYPYRASAVKNQQRWNFGALYPRDYRESKNGNEAWSMQTQCLVKGSGEKELSVRIRFLHLLKRQVGEVMSADLDHEHLLCVADTHFKPVASLECDERIYQTWEEAVEREVDLGTLTLAQLERPAEISFSFAGSLDREFARRSDGEIGGLIERSQVAVSGAVRMGSEKLDDDLYRVTITITNETGLEAGLKEQRQEALARSLVSTHTIISTREGELLSLLEPPEAYQEAAQACQNIGTWPVLVGEGGEHDCLLSSPIILYDYPQIAPESAGDLFDGTEIDEILTLRILTLTDEEKAAVRGTDEHARRILERTESLPAEQLMKLHGAMRRTAGKN